MFVIRKINVNFSLIAVKQTSININLTEKKKRERESQNTIQLRVNYETHIKIIW